MTIKDFKNCISINGVTYCYDAMDKKFVKISVAEIATNQIPEEYYYKLAELSLKDCWRP